jgi:hypothetical protein
MPACATRRSIDIYRLCRQTCELSPDSVARIIAIDLSEKTPDRFRTNNLLDVYAADVLTRQKDHTTSDSTKELRTTVRCFLRTRLMLSPRQIEKARLKLHRCAFGG